MVGRNGAGKSTFVRVLTGLESKATGVVDINNRSLSGPRQRLRQSYLVMQDVNHQLFGESVESDVIIGTSGPDGKNEARLTEVLGALDLADKRARHPMSLSGGERQRVAIASAVLSEREVIVFDEPTSGLDLCRMHRVAHLLDALARQGKTVLVVTHDMELVARCCDLLLRVEKGRLTACEPCDDLALARTVRYLRGRDS
ncbi:ATP-binding cassette domain-containing protein [Corynebacterium striatum]